MAVKSLSIISIAWFCLCFINTMILEPVIYNCTFGVYANYAMDVSSVVARSLFCIIFILWSTVGSVFVWKELSVPQKKAEESQSHRTTKQGSGPAEISVDVIWEVIGVKYNAAIANELIAIMQQKQKLLPC